MKLIDPLGLVIALAIWSIVGYLIYWNVKDASKEEEDPADFVL